MKILKIMSLVILGSYILACRKKPKDNSEYKETLNYTDNSSIERTWYVDYDKEEIYAVHIEDNDDTLSQKYFFYMNIINSDEVKSKKVWAFSYDKDKAILNGKHTLYRQYNYDGERYLKKGQVNYKGAFNEIIVYYDTSGVQANDTVKRNGTYTLEYQGETPDNFN